MRQLSLVLAAATVLTACEAGRKSSAGFHMPDGDPERGKAVFLEQRCNACHRVDGVSLPAPTVEPPVPVVLGGEVDHARTDGELVTAIIDPKHELAPGYKPELIQRQGVSRMPDYGQLLTVRQMIDLVAFLQSRYKVVRPGGRKG